MKTTFCCIGALVIASMNAVAQTPPQLREGIEWCDLWISHANETGLPRVLLIGDSITHGYHPEVEKLLAGKAYVNRLTTSAFLSDPLLRVQLAMALDSMKFDVIHFNNGMHGWQHSEEEYAKAFPEFLAMIRKHAPDAKLIWASTTPLKHDTTPTTAAAPADSKSADAAKLMLKADLAHVSDARINARNAIALRLVTAEKIPVDDLHAIAVGHPELHTDNVHFNKDGVALQAAQVAAEITKLLPNPKL